MLSEQSKFNQFNFGDSFAFKEIYNPAALVKKPAEAN